MEWQFVFYIIRDFSQIFSQRFKLVCVIPRTKRSFHHSIRKTFTRNDTVVSCNPLLLNWANTYFENSLFTIYQLSSINRLYSFPFRHYATKSTLAIVPIPDLFLCCFVFSSMFKFWQFNSSCDNLFDPDYQPIFCCKFICIEDEFEYFSTYLLVLYLRFVESVVIHLILPYTDLSVQPRSNLPKTHPIPV